MMAHHEIDFGNALGQGNRVSEIVFLGEGTEGLQQLGRRGLGERRGREHADASLVLAVPRGEQVIDAFHALVSQPGREPGGFTPGESVRRHRAGDVLAVPNRLREHAAQAGLRQRRREPADASGILYDGGGPGSYGLERRDGDHQRVLLPLEETRGLNGQARGVRESEILVEAAREYRCHVGVTVDEAWEQRLTASVVDVGVRIRPEDRVGGADRHDLVALHRERHVVLNGIDGDDGCMSEDDGPARRRLSPQTALVEKEGRGAGAGNQLPPTEVARAGHDIRRCTIERRVGGHNVTADA